MLPPDAPIGILRDGDLLAVQRMAVGVAGATANVTSKVRSALITYDRTVCVGTCKAKHGYRMRCRRLGRRRINRSVSRRGARGRVTAQLPVLLPPRPLERSASLLHLLVRKVSVTKSFPPRCPPG
jgi:hypothetical protein